MKKRMTLPALAAAGALAVAGCGEDDSSDSGAAAKGNGVDRAFVADMVPHHKSAVEMAKIAQQRGESPFVKKLAGDIVESQTAEITTLRREDASLGAAGVKKTSLGVPSHMMGMDSNPVELQAAKPFDAAFIKMMLPHHEGAVVMAKAELKKGGDPELQELAKEIAGEQEREIRAMREHLGGDAGDAEHGGGHSG